MGNVAAHFGRTARFAREPWVYRLDKYLKSYLHVHRPSADGRSIVGFCDEWMVRKNWETTYVLDITSTLQWLEEQELPNVERPPVPFDMSALCLPPL